MNSKEILSAAQKERERGREYENKIYTNSTSLACFVALLVGIALWLFEYFFKGVANMGLIAVGMTAVGVQALFEGIKTKKTYLIIIGIFSLMVATFSIITFVSKLVTK